VGTEGAGTTRVEPRWLTPDELETWIALNHLLARLPAALGAQLQCDADLSFVEYYVLAGLSDQPGRSMRMSGLASLANSELSRLSHLMTRLERRGFVRREPDPTDGRFTRAVLTEDGYAHLAAAAPGHAEKVRSLVFDVLDEDTQHRLRDAATTIVGHLAEGPC
jgi:DNA-binding MarR family transcriptional regulator